MKANGTVVAVLVALIVVVALFLGFGGGAMNGWGGMMGKGSMRNR